jgi:phage/plasmid-associated DNA primase
MTGITKADRALTSQSDFNGELAHTVFAVIEERDLSKVPGVNNKIKDVVTGMTLAIRKMRTDTFQIPNVTHWAQFSNHEHELLISTGDTRVTALHVPELEQGKEIAKGILLDRMTAEAPQFLRTLLDVRLPPLIGRLRLPMVETKDKRAISERANPVAAFVRERCVLDPQAKITKNRLWEAWELWCTENAIEPGTQSKFWSDLQTATRHRVKNDLKAADPQDGRRRDAYGGIRLRDPVIEAAA